MSMNETKNVASTQFVPTIPQELLPLNSRARQETVSGHRSDIVPQNLSPRPTSESSTFGPEVKQHTEQLYQKLIELIELETELHHQTQKIENEIEIPQDQIDTRVKEIRQILTETFQGDVNQSQSALSKSDEELRSRAKTQLKREQIIRERDSEDEVVKSVSVSLADRMQMIKSGNLHAASLELLKKLHKLILP